jgi:two-component system CheB/CheR fusion protein
MAMVPHPQNTTEIHPDQQGLVVVGSSAGGVEALTKLVSSLSAAFPAPLVLAQHLDPTQPSHLGEILARYSRLPVQTVTDHTPLDAGTIYVIPADRNVEVIDHELRLLPDGQPPVPSINLLFGSAARAFGERLIAVVLTGTGSDGASGAYQVKLEGGLVIIENPDTAAFGALPASLATTTVDYVADLERIGSLLSELLTKAETSAELSLPLESRSISDVDATAEQTTSPPLGVTPRQVEAAQKPG